MHERGDGVRPRELARAALIYWLVSSYFGGSKDPPNHLTPHPGPTAFSLLRSRSPPRRLCLFRTTPHASLGSWIPMASLHLHLRAVILAASLAALVAGSCSCPDRVVGDAPQGEGEPACLWLISPRAFQADGSIDTITDPAAARRVGTVCLCITQAEYAGLGDRLDRVRFPEEGTLLEEFNELGYDECKRLASLIEGAVDDECLEYYEHGTWLEDIYFATGQWANGKPPRFACYE